MHHDHGPSDCCVSPRAARSVDTHLQACLEVAASLPTPTETVPITEAAGRILAEDVAAALPVPPFSNSAMDGFLVHLADLEGQGPWTLPVAGDVPAGAQAVAVPAGHAVRIMTGAPTGEDTGGLTVIPVEDTTLPAGPVPLPAEVTITAAPTAPRHIRARGENIAIGEAAAPAGTLVDAGALAALVSVAALEVPVFRQPRVTVIATGDELVAAGQLPGAGQIPDSNSPMLARLVEETGLAGVRELRVGDAPDAFTQAIAEARESSELIITSGGVSAGAFDVVKEALSGTDVWFGKVAMQPGKPQGLGRVGDAAILCLPGNPVSSFVSFHLFALPVIQALAGLKAEPRPWLRARLSGELPAPRGRDLFVPARLSLAGSPVVGSATGGRFGSHFVASLTGVNALVHRGVDEGPAADGDTVLVTPL